MGRRTLADLAGDAMRLRLWIRAGEAMEGQVEELARRASAAGLPTTARQLADHAQTGDFRAVDDVIGELLDDIEAAFLSPCPVANAGATV